MHRLPGFNQHSCGVLYNYLSDRHFIVKRGLSLICAALQYLSCRSPETSSAHQPHKTYLQYADDTLIYATIKDLQNWQDRLNAY